MTTSIRLLLTVILATTLASGTLRAQTVAYPPGSGIGLAPPPGMTPSATFSGFEDRARGASILTADLPEAAYADILQSLTPEKLAPSGLKAAGPAVPWTVAGGEGHLVRGTQVANGVTYRKWVLLAHNPTTTAMLSVQVPRPQGDTLGDDAVEAALKTVALRTPPGIEEKIEALSFQIRDRAGFRPVRALAGSGVIFTEGSLDTLPDASQPVLVVASSISGAPPPAERVDFARRGFVAIEGVSDLSVDNEKVLDHDGASWSLIEGTGTYRTTSETIYVMQVTRFSGAGYLRAVGITRLAEKGRFADRFKRVAESMVPK